MIGNIQYANLFFATVPGFVLFSEVPDFCTIAGAPVIVGSAVYVYHREAIAKRSSV